MEFLIIVVLLPFVLWVVTVIMMQSSESKIHRLGRAYFRFLIKAFIFFIPLSILSLMFDYMIGKGTVSTVLSLALSALFYLKISRKYAKTLIKNLYL